MLYGGTYNILISLRKDVRNTSAIEADKSFTLPGHIFNTNTKFILIEQLEIDRQVDRKIDRQIDRQIEGERARESRINAGTAKPQTAILNFL